MKSRVFVTAAILFVLLITGLVVPAHTALATGTSAGTRQLSSSGTGVFVATQEGADGLQQPEFGPSLDDGPGASPASAHGQSSVNRSLTHALAQRTARVTGAKKPGD